MRKKSSKSSPGAVSLEELRPDEERIDGNKLRKLLHDKGMYQWQLAELTSFCSRSTLNRAINSGIIKKRYLDDIAKTLKIERELLQPSSKYEQKVQPEFVVPPPNDWMIERVITNFQQASNGVGYTVAKLKSTKVEGQLSRAKFYDLRKSVPKNLTMLQEQLTRHAVVCERLNHSPYVVSNRTVIPFENLTGWWVLDHWYDDLPLEQILEEKSTVPVNSLFTLGSNIIRGLTDLHNQNVVFRELEPSRILVSEDFGHCRLTDFEVAKLLGKGISVAGDWRKSQTSYRAPEINDEYPPIDVNLPRVDIYSWGRIMVELLTGDPMTSNDEIKASVKPPELADLLVKCCSSIVELRPRSIEELYSKWMKLGLE